MIKRDSYKPLKRGLSYLNEPNTSLIIKSDVRTYCDMYSAYNKFAELFGISTNNFILANGCENALKNVLLALRPKYMSYAIPTWGMLEVFCEALNITPITDDFIYDDGSIIYPDSIYDYYTDVLYDNVGITNLFTYDYLLGDVLNANAKYKILDVTYKRTSEIKELVRFLNNHKDVIIVGSFDKMFGCNLRLGFAIFHSSLHDKISLQREQFINSSAYSFLMSYDGSDPKPIYKKSLSMYEKKIFSLTDNFITLKGSKYTELNHKTFSLKTTKGELEFFTRLGMPKNKSELRSVSKYIYDIDKKNSLL